jgi:catechol 2,3-dioxygenase-like lactoylglutathione lyase family enzyme
MANHLHVDGFHQIAIKVRDFDASVKFYTEALGFEATRAWGEGNGRAAMIDTGRGNYLELFAGGADGVRPEGHWFHLALSCSDAKAAAERVREAGCEITMEATDVAIPSSPPFPVRIAFFKGPDGEVIELFQTH